MRTKIVFPVTAHTAGNIGQEIRDADGRTIAWTTDAWLAQVICMLMNDNEHLFHSEKEKTTEVKECDMLSDDRRCGIEKYIREELQELVSEIIDRETDYCRPEDYVPPRGQVLKWFADLCREMAQEEQGREEGRKAES